MKLPGASSTGCFIRDDGARLRVVEGFADQLISRRPGRTPRADWDAHDYERAAAKVVEQAERRADALARLGVNLAGARVLEVGCGTGLYSLALASREVELVAGVDLALPLFEPGPRGASFRRLASLVLAQLGLGSDIERALGELPIRLCPMDARELAFETDSFDLVWSGACLEHVSNVDVALAEMARVLRPRGRMYHRIDPFFWARGCHLPGLVDVPWAHARLSPDEYRRLMLDTHGTNGATERIDFVQSLNQFTVRQWRDVFDAAPLEMIRWEEQRLDWVRDLLGSHPEVTETTIKRVEPSDLTCSMITVVATSAG